MKRALAPLYVAKNLGPVRSAVQSYASEAVCGRARRKAHVTS